MIFFAVSALQTMSNKHWVKLSDIPFTITSRPIAINDYEIVFPPQSSNQHEKPYTFDKYDTINDKWSKWISFPNEVDKIFGATAAINQDKTLIYVHLSEGYLIQYNLKNLSSVKVEKDPSIKSIGHSAVATFVDNTFHIIGGLST